MVEPDGFEGRNAFIFLQDPIQAVDGRKWIKIRVYSPGNNILGWDGTFNDGLWSGADDEILTTSDPAGTGEGTNDNHIRLYTHKTDSGHQQNQYSGYITWRPRRPRKDLYIINFFNKMIGFDTVNLDGYKIEIEYLNHGGDSISVHYLEQDIGAHTFWKQHIHFICYRDLTDGKFYSGSGDSKHEVPAGTSLYRVRFIVEWNGGGVTYPTNDVMNWKIDDISIRNASQIPMSDTKELDVMSYNDEIIRFYAQRKLTGEIKINRIGMYQFKFGSSQAKGKPAFISDLSGKAGANPSSLVESSVGKTALMDINGNIVSAFIPKAGVKRQRVISPIGKTAFKEAMSDMESLTEPFGIIDPQCDFADYIISPNTMSWTAIDPASISIWGLSIPYTEAADHYWQGKLTLRET
jgi:hypothetical protein